MNLKIIGDRYETQNMIVFNASTAEELIQKFYSNRSPYEKGIRNYKKRAVRDESRDQELEKRTVRDEST
jgi:hypothetical protein